MTPNDSDEPSRGARQRHSIGNGNVTALLVIGAIRLFAESVLTKIY